MTGADHPRHHSHQHHQPLGNFHHSPLAHVSHAGTGGSPATVLAAATSGASPDAVIGIDSVVTLVHVISLLLMPDQSSIQMAERSLHHFLRRKESVLAVVQVMADRGLHTGIRQCAGVILRPRLGKLWSKLSAEERISIKRSLLFDVLGSAADVKEYRVCMAAADLIAVVAKYSLGTATGWPDLVPFVMELYGKGSSAQRETAVRLVDSMLQTLPSNGVLLAMHPQIISLLADALVAVPSTEEEANIKVVALRCISDALLESFACRPADAGQGPSGASIPTFVHALIPAILRAMSLCIALEFQYEFLETVVSLGMDSIVELSSLLGSEEDGDSDDAEELPQLQKSLSHVDRGADDPALVGSVIQFVFETISNRKQLASAPLVKERVLEYIVFILESEGECASLLVQSKDILGAILECIVRDLLPERGADVFFAILALAPLSEELKLFPLALQTIQRHIQEPEHQSASLYAVGLLAETCPEEVTRQLLPQVVPSIMTGFLPIDPKVSCFVLGQFAEYCHPEILEFHETVIPGLVQFVSAPQSSVQDKEKALVVLDVFCENVPSDLMARLYLSNLLLPCLSLLLQQPAPQQPSAAIVQMKGAAISTLASVAVASGEAFVPYAFSVLEFLEREFLSIRDPKILTLRARATECIGNVLFASRMRLPSSYEVAGRLADSVFDGLLTLDDPELNEYSYSFFSNLAEIFLAPLSSTVPEEVGPEAAASGAAEAAKTALFRIAERVFPLALRTLYQDDTHIRAGPSFGDDGMDQDTDEGEVGSSSEADGDDPDSVGSGAADDMQVGVHTAIIDEKASAIALLSKLAAALETPLQSTDDDARQAALTMAQQAEEVLMMHSGHFHARIRMNVPRALQAYLPLAMATAAHWSSTSSNSHTNNNNTNNTTTTTTNNNNNNNNNNSSSSREEGGDLQDIEQSRRSQDRAEVSGDPQSLRMIQCLANMAREDDDQEVVCAALEALQQCLIQANRFLHRDHVTAAIFLPAVQMASQLLASALQKELTCQQHGLAIALRAGAEGGHASAAASERGTMQSQEVEEEEELLADSMVIDTTGDVISALSKELETASGGVDASAMLLQSVIGPLFRLCGFSASAFQQPQKKQVKGRRAPQRLRTNPREKVTALGALAECVDHLPTAAIATYYDPLLELALSNMASQQQQQQQQQQQHRWAMSAPTMGTGEHAESILRNAVFLLGGLSRHRPLPLDILQRTLFPVLAMSTSRYPRVIVDNALGALARCFVHGYRMGMPLLTSAASTATATATSEILRLWLGLLPPVEDLEEFRTILEALKMLLLLVPLPQDMGIGRSEILQLMGEHCLAVFLRIEPSSTVSGTPLATSSATAAVSAETRQAVVSTLVDIARTGASASASASASADTKQSDGSSTLQSRIAEALVRSGISSW